MPPITIVIADQECARRRTCVGLLHAEDALTARILVGRVTTVTRRATRRRGPSRPAPSHSSRSRSISAATGRGGSPRRHSSDAKARRRPGGGFGRVGTSILLAAHDVKEKA